MISLRQAFKDERGMTLPELIVVMIVSVALSSLVMYFTFNFWRGTATLQNDSEVLVSRLNAGDSLRDLIGESSGLVIQNGIPDTHTHNPDTIEGSGQYWLPQHAVPRTIVNGSAGVTTPVIYLRQPAVNSSKEFIMNGLQVYENEYVLYMNNASKTLLLRTLANTSAPGNATVTSCPTASASESCPEDRLIAENVESVTTRYFSRSGNTVNYESTTDPDTGEYIGPDFPSVEVVELSIKLFKRSTLSGGQDTSNQTIIRVGLRNT